MFPVQRRTMSINKKKFKAGRQKYLDFYKILPNRNKQITLSYRLHSSNYMNPVHIQFSNKIIYSMVKF